MNAASLQNLNEAGFTVMRGVFTPPAVDRIRDEVLGAVGDRELQHPWDILEASKTTPRLAGLRSHERIQHLVSVVCGADPKLLIDMVTIRGQEDPGLDWHADTAVWVVPPFPPEAQVLTLGFCLDDIPQGGTRFIPSSHRYRREPTEEDLTNANFVEPPCKAGDVLAWRGETWHGRASPKAEGERVFYVCAYGNSAIPAHQRDAEDAPSGAAR